MLDHPLYAMTLRNPMEIEPRLILADWLDEMGDPQGEFIRVQCTLQNQQVSDAAYVRLLLRERLLLAQYEGYWLKRVRRKLRLECGIGRRAGPGTSARWELRFVGGLTGQLSLRIKDFESWHQEIRNSIPLEDLTLSQLDDSRRPAEVQTYAQVRRLCLRGSHPARDEPVVAHLMQQDFRSLQTLTLRSFTINQNLAKLISSASIAAQILKLQLSSCVIEKRATKTLTATFGERLFCD